jgi:hypothetical protein
MIKHFCDACKNEIKEGEFYNVKAVRIIKTPQFNSASEWEELDIDLHDTCYHAWLRKLEEVE